MVRSLRLTIAAATLAAVLLPAVPASPANRNARREKFERSAGTVNTSLPLLRWDLLRRAFYNPPAEVTFPDSVKNLDEQRVWMEGYIMPNFGSQDPADLLLSGINPRNLFCGPTDMTAIVEVYFPGFDPKGWPTMPIAIEGTFSLSKHPTDLDAVYRLRGSSWHPLHHWVQSFPGVVDELEQQDQPGP